MNKLIMVEGIPGSGKSTIAKRISDYLSLRRKTNAYFEGDLHPADLAWCACIPIQELDNIINKFNDYKIAIESNMYIENGYAIVAYTKFPISNKKLYNLLESYEVYDNRVGYEVFTKLHFDRWSRFSKQAENLNEINVFECSFLQNHINESLFFHKLDTNKIIEHLISLIETVRNLNPVLFYLNQENVEETLKRVSNIRVNEKGEKIWMGRVIEYIENSPYGMSHNLKGFEGMVKAFESRRKIELEAIELLPIKSFAINNECYDWENIWAEIKKNLSELF